MEVMPKDILLRIGCGPHGVVVAGGARRAHGTFAPGYTHTRADASTCATAIDRDGVLRVAAANKLRVEYVDLDGDGVRETPGLLLEGSRTNLCLRSSDFANATWLKTGTPVTTTGETVLGSLSLDLLDDNDGAAIEEYEQTITYTGDGTKGLLFHAKAGTATTTRVDVFDVTAAASRGDFTITWTAGVPGVVAGSGGVLLKSELLSNGIYRFFCTVAGVVAANTNRIRVFPAGATASATGTTRVGGMQTENAAFPSSLISTTTATVTRAADSLTLPFNFGPIDCTVLIRVARPIWADATGDLGFFPTVLNMGGVNDPNLRIEIVGRQGTREWQSRFGTSGSEKVAAIPAGASLAFSTQCKNASTLPAVAIDVGSGLTTFDTGAPAFTAYTNQTLEPGHPSVKAFCVFLDIIIARGLFSLSEMSAAL
jgi:hypothetical protein